MYQVQTANGQLWPLIGYHMITDEEPQAEINLN